MTMESGCIAMKEGLRRLALKTVETLLSLLIGRAGRKFCFYKKGVSRL